MVSWICDFSRVICQKKMESGRERFLIIEIAAGIGSDRVRESACELVHTLDRQIDCKFPYSLSYKSTMYFFIIINFK